MKTVVGWFREYREEHVPDLDASSLHTRPREGTTDGSFEGLV